MIVLDSKRKIYDKYGEEGLKEGGGRGFGGGGGTYNFSSSNADDIFKMFFSNDMDSGFSSFGNDDFFNPFFGQKKKRKKKMRKGKTIAYDLFCTLEELYRGKTKKVKITRKVKSGYETIKEFETLEINIKPGWKQGTKITYPKKGNRINSIEPGDVVFIIKEKEHDKFKRIKNDLIYKHTITLKQALTGHFLEITTLDNRKLELQFANNDEVIQPGQNFKIPNEGMPYSNNSKRGDLYIEFSVVFPTKIKQKSKKILKEIL
ncbi:DNAj [Anaeramoeba flamelloides]|uniref:DNAj n=1 Tax=Anaeramoeba flamelloides TaxID=1746091 RepID=A0AAV7Y9T3_9EUKA|nr:DNAj [Anaeramoeba flamelloides]